MADKNSNKITSNKFALIYEFNNQSPLFARVATDFYENGNYDKSIEILESGLKIHPNYPSAYFIYAQVLAATGNLEKAKEIVAIGSELIDSDETKEFYLELIVDISNTKGSLPLSKRTSFLDNNDLDNLPQDDIDENLRSDQLTSNDKPPQFEDNLDKLAQELENAKIQIPEESDKDLKNVRNITHEYTDKDEDYLASEFISETLAGIYFAQKNYNAAKDIYQKLIEIEPEKADLFNNKIVEIDNILKNE